MYAEASKIDPGYRAKAVAAASSAVQLIQIVVDVDCERRVSAIILCELARSDPPLALSAFSSALFSRSTRHHPRSPLAFPVSDPSRRHQISSTSRRHREFVTVSSSPPLFFSRLFFRRVAHLHLSSSFLPFSPFNRSHRSLRRDRSTCTRYETDGSGLVVRRGYWRGNHSEDGRAFVRGRRNRPRPYATSPQVQVDEFLG